MKPITPVLALGSVMLVSSCALLLGTGTGSNTADKASSARIKAPTRVRVAFQKPAPIRLSQPEVAPLTTAARATKPVKKEITRPAHRPSVLAAIQPAPAGPGAATSATPTLTPSAAPPAIPAAKPATPLRPRPRPIIARATPTGPATVIPKPRALALATPDVTPKAGSRPKPRILARLFPARKPAKPVEHKAGQTPLQRGKTEAKTGTITPTPPRPVRQASSRPVSGLCGPQLVRGIPRRGLGAPSGSRFIKTVMDLRGPARDRVVERQLLAGNIPSFLSDLRPVTLRGLDATGAPVAITICVAPDYLSVGNNRDFVRVPMGLPAAVEVTRKLGFMLPTTKMVDAIYRQAALHLAPSPMQASRQMSSTAYLWTHNKTVNAQIANAHAPLDELVAGQKKDLVLSNALTRTPGRVAIYGWHRKNGKAIQPLSTVHGQNYADYSHGIRLVAKTAFVNGRPRALKSLLANPKLASVISKEGPLKRPLRLVARLAMR